MQSVQEWSQGNSKPSQATGGFQSVSDWKNNQGTQVSTNFSGLTTVTDWKKSLPQEQEVAPPVVSQKISPIKSFPNRIFDTLKGYSDSLGVTEKVKSYANESADTLRNFPNKIMHPIQELVNFSDNLKNEWMAGVTKAGTPVEHGNVVTDISNLITGFGQAFFSPVTALFQEASTVPGLKQAADAINIPFTALGLGGKFVSDKLVDSLPKDIMNNDTREVVRQSLGDLSSLTAQLVFGGKVFEKLGKIGETKKPGEKITMDEVTKTIQEVKKETPESELVSEPKPVQAPQISATTNIIKEGPAIPTQPISVEEWVKSGKPKEPIITTPEVAKPVQGGTVNSKVYERLKEENSNALTGEVKYDPITLKEEGDKAAKLIETNKQEAFDIAMNRKTSSEVTSTATNIVMAEKALQDGNIELYRELTKKRSLDQTRRGQEIVSEKLSVNNNSVSRYVQELIETRLNKLGNSYLGKMADFSKTMKKAKTRAMKAIDNEVTQLTTKINSKKLDVKTALDLLDKLKCI